MKNLRMKAARAALDLSQQQLADAVGVSRQTGFLLLFFGASDHQRH